LLLQAQTEVLLRLHDRGLPVAVPLAATNGNYAGKMVLRDPALAESGGEPCALRLLTYLTGVVLLNAKQVGRLGAASGSPPPPPSPPVAAAPALSR
jgi:Ser/Thr protein kinase RdoA (MazF antagonist)